MSGSKTASKKGPTKGGPAKGAPKGGAPKGKAQAAGGGAGPRDGSIPKGAELPAGVAEVAASPEETPRLLQRYRDEIRARLHQEFGYTNPMQVPRLEKIVINMGVGEATGRTRRSWTARSPS